MGKLNCRLAIVCLFGVASSAYAQQPKMRFFEGDCAAALNNTEVGCEGKQVLTTLPNGRTIMNFTGREIATVGFAGKLQALDPEHITLWIDGAYINQTRQAADGQCSLTRRGASFSVDCKAILHDGRKLVATAQETKERSERPLNSQASPKPGKPGDCNAIMHAQGFLSRAQFQCGYQSYSAEMLQKARECSRSLGKPETEAALKSGMNTFDRNEQERGHANLCADILKKFPGIVKR